MRMLWWQRLPLLILIQLLEPNCTSHKLYSEALLICKNKVLSPPEPGVRFGRFPCLRQWAYVRCYGGQDPYVFSSIPGIYHLSFPTELIKLSSFASKFLPSNYPIQLQEKFSKSRNRRIAASVDRDNDGVPTLTPLQEDDVKKPRKQTVAAVVGGAAAALLVIIILVLVYICLMRVKKFMRRTSQTASSVPSPPAELQRVDTSHHAAAVTLYDEQGLRKLTIQELQHATCNFSPSKIIGGGAFGLVYKGLLQDGSIVAIKRYLHSPIPSSLHEVNVKQIARASHKNLVKLVGYCEDSHEQLLVYDYIPNGNVGNHLYDSEGFPTGKLNMRQRLFIALGAAKGLEYLHSLVPPILHTHFRSSNVLLDENFTAKVSDYGLSKLVSDFPSGASSSAIDCFLDPEMYSSKKFSAQSDVYSFGVFLLELISGREAHGRNQFNSEPSLVLQAKDSRGIINFVDESLRESPLDAAKQTLELALQCVDFGVRRPSMQGVVEMLERIQEGEIGHLHSELGQEIDAVMLGSELFK